MQAKKAKQLLRARLARERQIYEMRKRAELKAAVSELERPWEVVQRAPTLFSVKADEQVKVLADRFQKPGGFDMWSDRDGPQLFETPDGFPSARFFPKGVVHSIKPYGVVPERSSDEELDSDFDSEIEFVSTVDRGIGIEGNKRNVVPANSNHDGDLLGIEANFYSESEFGNNTSDSKCRSRNGFKFRKQGNRSRFRSGIGSLNSEKIGSGREQRRNGDSNDRTARPRGNRFRGDKESLNSEQVGLGRNLRGDGSFMPNSDAKTYRTNQRNMTRNLRYSKSEVYDMDLQQDGSYGFQAKTRQSRAQNAGN